ncbi:MAG: nucleoside deaminase [Bacteroidota bacterium]
MILFLIRNISSNYLITITLLFLGVSLQSCRNEGQENGSQTKEATPIPVYTNDSEIQKERDEIFSLLAYSIVRNDWQYDSVPRFERRGYNIGSVLVDPQGFPVYAALNCVTKQNNATQHGEVRLMTQYIDTASKYNLRNHTIYTTLEPCAMCAGMMIMTSVERIIFGQRDIDFSGTFGRMAIDSRSIGGYPPFPREVISEPAPTPYYHQLDSAFQKFLNESDEKYLSKFLTTPIAKDIFSAARESFLGYQVKHEENLQILDQARELYSRFVPQFN